jgi:hypothetical protein
VLSLGLFLPSLRAPEYLLPNDEVIFTHKETGVQDIMLILIENQEDRTGIAKPLDDKTGQI